jgi:hypothetical protein
MVPDGYLVKWFTSTKAVGAPHCLAFIPHTPVSNIVLSLSLS